MVIPYPHISPEIFRIGPVVIRWYSVMYLVGYVVGYRLTLRRAKQGYVKMTADQVDAWIAYLVVGMLVGARLTYALVYHPGFYLDEPLELLKVWHGGLSFHGAVVGMVTACIVFARVHRVPVWEILDNMAYAGTPGLFFGRMGNFINGELYGRPTSLPWAMIFPADPLQVPRHPSQLYEALAEGIVLFLLLAATERWARRRGRYRPGLLTAGFLVGYGVLRFLIEFTRQPDAQLGLALGPLSMGQLLCLGMIVLSPVVLAFVYLRPAAAEEPRPGRKPGPRTRGPR